MCMCVSVWCKDSIIGRLTGKWPLRKRGEVWSEEEEMEEKGVFKRVGRPVCPGLDWLRGVLLAQRLVGERLKVAG